MAKILVVDDRPANRQFLMTLLGYAGHALREAHDGQAALDAGALAVFYEAAEVHEQLQRHATRLQTESAARERAEAELRKTLSRASRGG